VDRLRLYRGQRRSRSGRQLAREIGIRLVRTRNSRFTARATDLILNWGSTERPAALADARWLNKPEAVALAVDKLRAFERMEREDVATVQFTGDRDKAAEWSERGSAVVVRRQLRGTGGAGIILRRPGESIPDAPLYTRYFRAQDEYRLHVYRGRVFDIQHKRRRLEADASNEIRNSANGWVYTREGVTCIAAAHAEAIAAVASLGLDFGAVDLKVSGRGTVGILEVNTAPGLEGTTLNKYAECLGAGIHEG